MNTNLVSTNHFSLFYFRTCDSDHDGVIRIEDLNKEAEEILKRVRKISIISHIENKICWYIKKAEVALFIGELQLHTIFVINFVIFNHIWLVSRERGRSESEDWREVGFRIFVWKGKVAKDLWKLLPFLPIFKFIPKLPKKQHNSDFQAIGKFVPNVLY